MNKKEANAETVATAERERERERVEPFGQNSLFKQHIKKFKLARLIIKILKSIKKEILYILPKRNGA